MVYHIITGDHAGDALKNALSTISDNEYKLLVIKDIFNVGPLLKKEGQRFSEMRSQFWQEVNINEKHPVVVDDLERLLLTCNELSKFEHHELWIWMAALPADVCTYYLVMKYAGKYLGKVKVLNINGLPFLDDSGKLFFPKSIAELNVREITKAMKLVRTVNAGEVETDIEEWDRLIAENGGIRLNEGSKKIISKDISHYDKLLLVCCLPHFQKAAKIVNTAMLQHVMPVGDLFLGWRLRKMAEEGKLQIQGDITRTLKDFEVKLHDGTLL